MPAPTTGPTGTKTPEGISTWLSTDKPTREGVNYNLEEIDVDTRGRFFWVKKRSKGRD